MIRFLPFAVILFTFLPQTAVAQTATVELEKIVLRIQGDVFELLPGFDNVIEVDPSRVDGIRREVLEAHVKLTASKGIQVPDDGPDYSIWHIEANRVST